MLSRAAREIAVCVGRNLGPDSSELLGFRSISAIAQPEVKQARHGYNTARLEPRVT